MGKSERRKGAAGELELARILSEELGVEMKRRLNQTRDSGYDLEGLNLAIEVKRREKADVMGWWRDAVKKSDGKIPVLAYRASRQPWRFMMPVEALMHGHHFVNNYADTATLFTSGFAYWVRENWDRLKEI